MEAPTPAGGLPRVTLVAPIRTTLSGSRAFLGLASDGQHYWVKAPGNPQGLRTLVAEVVVHGVGVLLGAPVRPIATIEIPDSLRWTYAPGYSLAGGLGHASLDLEPVVVSDEWTTYSAQDDNRRRQAFVFALWDLCMGGDPQWLHSVADDFTIWSYDHGFWLGGDGDWSLDSLIRVGVRPWQYDLEAEGLSSSGLAAAAEAVRKLSLSDLHAVVDSIPLEWRGSGEDLSSLAEIIFVRADGVAARLAEAARTSNFE